MQALENPARSTAKMLADAEITAAIELHFLAKKGVASRLIEVMTRDGVVELIGSTNSLLSRQRAEEIALAMRGVRGVINELVVCADDVPGADLHQQVQQALADDTATRAYNLSCKVASGMVWLTGTVQSWAEKQLALRVVEGVRGVRHIVHDHLVVRTSGPPKTDVELTTQLQELLDWDIRVNPKLVQVRATDRVVHLTGTVCSAAVKTHIENLVLELGAVRVEARDLGVAHWALEPHQRGEDDTPRTDEAIAQAARDTLGRDPRLQDTAPQVQVLNGVITLSGTVSNLRAQLAAEHDARHVVGGHGVQNLLTVSPDRFWSDADIRQRVVAALHRDPYLSEFNFRVTVLNGQATLHGWVENRFEQEQAYEVAAGVNGVVDVENRVTVFTDGQAAARAQADDLTGARAVPARLPAVLDEDLTERIRTRYFWSASLHDQHIEVRTENSRVTLTGTVDTWLERRMAAREAYELGARDVNNHLNLRRAFQPHS